MPLLSKEELIVRLRSHVVPGRRGVNDSLTLRDIALWTTHDVSMLGRVSRGKSPITHNLQLRLTQFYQLWDRGELILTGRGRDKALVRCAPGALPPPRPPKPTRVVFTANGPRVVL